MAGWIDGGVPDAAFMSITRVRFARKRRGGGDIQSREETSDGISQNVLICHSAAALAVRMAMLAGY